MLDFIRLDTGQLLVGAAIFTKHHHLFPLCADNVVGGTRDGRLVLGMKYADPVHVVVYPFNDNGAGPVTTAVIH